MKIGFLHSVKLNLGSIANAKLYRIMFEDWNSNPQYWWGYWYGQATVRAKLRGLIYKYRSYYEEFKDFNDYSLIALSLNFDTYPSDFQKFVTEIINELYEDFPILYQKEVIIMAGNEVFEKRRSAEKVFETCFDTKKGIEQSVKPNLPVCGWNQKIRTASEVKAFQQLCKSDLMKSTCKYMGIQSLETSPENIRKYTLLARSKGYEVIDVELMTTTNRFSEIKMKFDNDRLLGIDKVFIGCPYISKELADYNEMFGKYALQIGNTIKDKQKIIKYVQEFKDKKEEVFNKMFDDILFNIIYKYGTRGIGVKRIQKIFNLWLSKDFQEGISSDISYVLLTEDGLYGSKTKEAIRYYQNMNNLTVDGVSGRETLTTLMNFMLKRYNKGETK